MLYLLLLLLFNKYYSLEFMFLQSKLNVGCIYRGLNIKFPGMSVTSLNVVVSVDYCLLLIRK